MKNFFREHTVFIFCSAAAARKIRLIKNVFFLRQPGPACENILGAVFKQYKRKDLGLQVFESWFKPLHLQSLTAAAAHIEVPSQFFSNWLKENYMDIIRDTFFFFNRNAPGNMFYR